MIIGIDFDNTIIDYHTLFYDAGIALGVLPETISRHKTEIRKYLIDRGDEQDWIKIQGLVYGKFITNAQVMDGFSSFSDLCYEKGWKIYIISHKTRESIIGQKFDLHASARIWLKDSGIYGTNSDVAVEGIFFELTRSDKVHRINQLGCDILIDDLVDVLLHPDLKNDIKKILYDPDKKNTPNSKYYTATGWNQIGKLIQGLYE